MRTKKAVEVRDLSYKYLDARGIESSFSRFKQVLKNISFSILEGERVSIIGPNGAGKSTLLLNIAGLMDKKYRSGEIFIYDKKLDGKNMYNIREKIGFVFQDPNDQLFSTTVFEDVSFGLINYLNKKKDRRAKDKKYIDEVVKNSLAKVNLKGFEKEIPHFLSYGEKKLVALATVLSYSPKILILDEPTSNLDPKNRGKIIKMIKRMNKTTIIATHDLDLAYEFSNRCILLNEGRVVFNGSSKEILEDELFLKKNNLDLPLMFKKIPLSKSQGLIE